MRWKKLISESVTPSDEDTIMASFHHDVSEQKFSPTREFLETAYILLNGEFFNGKLPENIRFLIKVQPTKSYIGMASYIYDNNRLSVKTSAVTLNGSRTLTLHEWLEVVLHEMIHVLDYETNPQHFVGYLRYGYDSHGHWFMEQGKKYESAGFHVQRYCNADIGVNTDNSKVQNRISNSVFLYMKGSSQRPLIMKMARKNLDRNLEFITNRIGNGSQFGIGVNEIQIMTSNNPNIARLQDLRMRDSSSRISWWWFDDDFEKKFGPFEVEDKVNILSAKNPVNEQDSEAEEVQPEEPEEIIDQIEDSIEGVEEVKQIGDDKFMVSIQ